MIVPELARMMATPQFWARYMNGEHDGTRYTDVELEIPVDAHAPRTVWRLQGDGTFTVLTIDDVFLGRDGGDEQYPPYPDALRCVEVELLARAAALVDPDLPHPGPVAALLAKLAPITTDFEANHWSWTVQRAFDAIGAPMPPTHLRFWDQALVTAFDVRSSKFRWVSLPRGYVLVQASKRRPEATVASLRVETFARVWRRGVDLADVVADYPELDGANFPHAALAETIAAARATCNAAVTARSDRTRSLAQQIVANDRGAALVLGDALDGNANPLLVEAVRRGHKWAAEVVAGVEPWQPITAA